MIDEIKAAAKWWADLLRARRHPATDTGDAELSFLFATVQVSPQFTDEQAARFETALVDVLVQAYVQQKPFGRFNEIYRPGRGFGTDYHPGDLLTEAAKAAEIDIYDCLPGKTIMWVRPGNVDVKRGYGAPIHTIYPERNP